MPSKKQYNLVSDDAYDCRIPLYNEDAFQHGITFHAKYIGSLDVPRPTSRVEIVAAMRRIRYEFKAKSVKKKKVSLTISVDGVKVLIRNKKKTNQWIWDENKFIVMRHPIYRIFYVSHDSQDLKIFSYIARDGGTNAFKCNVFKSNKKSQAMRIVRTIGQAFEVCHKLSLAITSSHGCTPTHDEIDLEQIPDHSHKGDGASEPNSCDTQAEEAAVLRQQEVVPVSLPQENHSTASTKKLHNDTFNSASDCGVSTPAVLSLSQHIGLLREQIESQHQQMEEVTLQVQLLKDQLAAETNARLHAQAQNEHLLMHNRELLKHITKLVKQFHELEQKYRQSGDGNGLGVMTQLSALPELLPFHSASLSSYHVTTDKMKKDDASDELPFGKSSDDPFIGNDSFLNAYERPFSTSNVNFPESPQLENRNHYLIGQSLPGSPSRRNFSIDSDGLIKCHSPIAGFQPSKSRPSESAGDILIHGESTPSYTFDKPSSTSPRQRKRADESFEYPSSDSSVSIRPNPYGKTLPHSSVPHSLDDSKYSYVNNNSAVKQHENDSFIAQVARDLAKLQVSQKETFGAESRFPSLFNKS